MHYSNTDDNDSCWVLKQQTCVIFVTWSPTISPQWSAIPLFSFIPGYAGKSSKETEIQTDEDSLIHN